MGRVTKPELIVSVSVDTVTNRVATTVVEGVVTVDVCVFVVLTVEVVLSVIVEVWDTGVASRLQAEVTISGAKVARPAGVVTLAEEEPPAACRL